VLPEEAIDLRNAKLTDELKAKHYRSSVERWIVYS